ncbi:FKBP-type peptidyl-prolyl cis-trans isomerase [Flammeovirga sp. SubArs3]|uniref:FKBP-type peptidyl-prolyl cis-trans isomerase n=1 Tax=Flammeovirga sp. SubArs3 TaxID=2995316 RepID=UPI00248AE559|nr:FKBP-type peptidyl-prolyl cis-trans isomerase [Flammeovirga sp. SubArs3]
MNNTYKFFKWVASLGLALGLSGCMHDDIVDYVAQDTETLETYLNSNNIDYYKTSTLGQGYGVYITPPDVITPLPGEPEDNDVRIIQSTLDLRKFDQSLIDNEQIGSNPDELVTQVFLKDSLYTFAVRRGAICLGYLDALINMQRGPVAERVYIPSYLAFGGTASSGIGLEFNDIVTAEDLKIVDVRDARSQAEYEKALALQYAADSIDGFVSAEQGLMDSTSVVATDFYGEGQDLILNDYIVKHTITEGEGDLIAVGDTVKVRYEGKFANLGSSSERAKATLVFDDNITEKDGSMPDALQVVVYSNSQDASEKNASTQVINGWYKALRSMKVGEKAIFVMPSHVAYWETGDNPNTFDLFKTIRPFKTLVFTMEIKKDEQ